MPPIQLSVHIGNARSLQLDTNSPNQQFTQPVIEEQTLTTDQTAVAMHDEPKGNNTDLLYRIHGLYRLLDLTSEKGSGGAGMISVPSSYIPETQSAVIHKWTRSSSLKSPWRSL